MSPRPLKMALPPAGERLEEQLRLLKLTRIAPVLDSIAQACAREKAGYLDFLSRLLEIELEERRERKVDLLQRFAAFPYKKSLEQFDFDFQPTVDRRLIADLATLRFLDHAENVILVGPPGTGKTMISIGLGLKATEAGRRVLFTTADDLVGALSRAFEENRLEEKLKVYTNPSLLDHRRDRLSAARQAPEQSALPGDLAPLRTWQHHLDQQQRLQCLGRGLRRRPGDRKRHPRPPAPPLPRHQHPRRELPPQGEKAGRPLLPLAPAPGERRPSTRMNTGGGSVFHRQRWVIFRATLTRPLEQFDGHVYVGVASHNGAPFFGTGRRDTGR